jgi:uncharacterized protein
MFKLQQGIEFFQASNYIAAFELLFPLAKDGNAEAQSVIACMYELGLGRKSEISKAIFWYEQSAVQGHIIALNNLANIFLIGKDGCLVDLSKAISLYRKSAELGFALSQYSLGKIYLEGFGVSTDKTEAIKWLKLAAEQNFQPAETMMTNISDLE